jgi:pyridoxamine 5'-phosphate oxidase-like protein
MDLDRVKQLGARENGLVVVVTSRADGTTQASVVNAGVLDDPVDGEPVVAFVARGGVRKLVHLRVRPRLTLVFRSGWDWVAVEGNARLVGPDDALEGLDPADVPRLIRDVYAAAAGGDSDAWAALDETLASERHTAVLVRPIRVDSNPGS